MLHNLAAPSMDEISSGCPTANTPLPQGAVEGDGSADACGDPRHFRSRYCPPPVCQLHRDAMRWPCSKTKTSDAPSAKRAASLPCSVTRPPRSFRSTSLFTKRSSIKRNRPRLNKRYTHKGERPSLSAESSHHVIGGNCRAGRRGQWIKPRGISSSL